ncbi:MAG: hypothetical protein E6Q97_16005 [Desulfurellales bacterium]|nr:MAG: hypothetical protein E6Q97_16005 [Desulfurellales bacterium]
MSALRAIGTAGALGLGAYAAYKTANFVGKQLNKATGNQSVSEEERTRQATESRAKATRVGARIAPTDPKQFS